MNDYPENPSADDDETRSKGLYCFMDSTRECGPDCMAYLPEPADLAVPGLSVQQKNCILIVSVERLGRYGSGLVSILRKGQERTEKDAADKKREDRMPPPIHVGRKI